MPTQRTKLTVTVVSPEGEITLRMEFSERETISIGRSNESDICLDAFGSRVSRCHAVIMHDGHQWEYYNLGVNGTFENGHQVESRILDETTVFRIARNGPILRLRIAVIPAADETGNDLDTELRTELRDR